jgi:FKBP-type peptidyl-prolyl cis-trans isomerase 2
MGDKKRKEARIKTVKQVIVVGACVLFVILMILSGTSSHWLSIFQVIKPGDTVGVDYTLYDATGIPILTSNQQIYTATAAKGGYILYTKQLSMTAGQNLTKNIYPVTVSSGSTESTTQFALLSTEYQAINQAVVGMKTGDQERIQIPNSSEPKLWDAATVTKSGLNVSDLHVGDLLPMAMSDNPQAMATNSTITYTRFGEIMSKTDEGIVVDVNYPAVDISIVSINANS